MYSRTLDSGLAQGAPDLDIPRTVNPVVSTFASHRLLANISPRLFGCSRGSLPPQDRSKAVNCLLSFAFTMEARSQRFRRNIQCDCRKLESNHAQYLGLRLSGELAQNRRPGSVWESSRSSRDRVSVKKAQRFRCRFTSCVSSLYGLRWRPFAADQPRAVLFLLRRNARWPANLSSVPQI